MDRYSRHNLIDWFSQEEVSRKSVCVIGAGAVGNEIIKSLVLLGIGNLLIIDFDLIEEHNLTKSVLFRPSDVGLSKAEVAAKRAKELDPNVDINFYHGDATQILKLSKLRNFDCVISCVDNFEARIKLNEMSRIAEVDFINLGIDSKYASVEVYPYSSGTQVACYECNLPHSVYGKISERYSCGYLKKISYEEKKIPTTIITSGIAGSLGASAALRIGVKDSQSSRRILVDTISGHSSITSNLSKVSDCPSCSKINHKYEVIGVSRKGGIGAIFDAISTVSSEVVIFLLSEPVVISSLCSICGNAPYDGAFNCRAQSELDETARFCSICVSASVDINFKDEISLHDFANLFSKKPVPISYVTTSVNGRNYCFSFEDKL